MIKKCVINHTIFINNGYNLPHKHTNENESKHSCWGLKTFPEKVLLRLLFKLIICDFFAFLIWCMLDFKHFKANSAKTFLWYFLFVYMILILCKKAKDVSPAFPVDWFFQYYTDWMDHIIITLKIIYLYSNI